MTAQTGLCVESDKNTFAKEVRINKLQQQKDIYSK